MGLRSFLGRFKKNLGTKLSSLIGSPADAACWQTVDLALETRNFPDTGNEIGDAIVRGIPAGVVGGVADGVVPAMFSLVANLVYAKCCAQHGTQFASNAKEAIFQTVFQSAQSILNGVTWQALASGGEIAGAYLGGLVGYSDVGRTAGGSIACFTGTFLTTWLTNKVYTCLTGQDSGVSSFAAACGSVGFYAVGPLPDFSPSGRRDAISAATLAGSGTLAATLLEEGIRSAVQEYKQKGDTEREPLLDSTSAAAREALTA